MKLFCGILILVAGFSACGKIDNFTNLTQQKIETENTETEQPDAAPILEITQNAAGAFKVTGKTLLLNLYENGIIEFEYFDEKKLESGKFYKAEEVNILKRAKIGAAELKKFTDLINSEAFQKLESEYNGLCAASENLDYKIDFQNANKQKSILMKCIETDSADTKVLSDLMILTDQTRQKYISEKSSNQTQ
jgi:hypothetical protein